MKGEQIERKRGLKTSNHSLREEFLTKLYPRRNLESFPLFSHFHGPLFFPFFLLTTEILKIKQRKRKIEQDKGYKEKGVGVEKLKGKARSRWNVISGVQHGKYFALPLFSLPRNFKLVSTTMLVIISLNNYRSLSYRVPRRICSR